jgi:hypothetical protein
VFSKAPGGITMMTASSEPASSKATHRKPPSGVWPTIERREKQRITAVHRWLLISKSIYGKAQQRGFVGGDPFGDLSEAAREIDEEYSTDVHGLLALTDSAELIEQFRSLFAGYGLGQQALDRLLDMNREALEKLAESNLLMHNGKAERTARRTSLLQDAADEAMKTVHSLTRNIPHADDTLHLIEHPAQAIRNTLARLRDLASSAPEISALSARDKGKGKNKDKGKGKGKGRKKSRTPREMEIPGAVVKAYEGLTASDLAEAPVAALKGVSVVNGKKLKSAFRMNTIRDMVASKLLERAEGVVTLADAGQDAPVTRKPAASSSRADSLSEVADGPVDRLQDVTRRQAEVLEEAFRIRTVRDLAENRYFRVARAIVTLAELKE